MNNKVENTIAVLGFVILSVLTVFLIFNGVETDELNWTNERLSELKASRDTKYLDLNDPEAKIILDQGAKLSSERIDNSIIISLALIAFYSFLLVKFIKRKRSNEK